jgi:hypothetical protein
MPRGPLWLAFVSVALAVLLFALPSSAQRVVVLRPSGVDPVLSEAFNRLRAELALQDFEVVVLDAKSSELDAKTLSELARREQAFAGISLSRRVESASADVCIADRVTGKISLRTLSLSDAKDAPSVLAVRAVDLLRSSLREFGPDERASSDVVGVDRGPVPEAVHDWTRATPSNFRLGASAMALLVEPRLGVAFGPTLSLHARSLENLLFGVVLSGPLVGTELTAGGGRAVLRQELLLGEVSWTLVSTRRFELGPALFVGAYHLDAKGEAVPPLLSRSEQVWSLALGAGVQTGMRLSERVLVTFAARALSLSPRPAVAVHDDRQNFAPVIALASLGLGVEF